MRLSAVAVPFFTVMLASMPAFASFGGCVISPENPTFILGALGAGAAVLPWLQSRLKSRLRQCHE